MLQVPNSDWLGICSLNNYELHTKIRVTSPCPLFSLNHIPDGVSTPSTILLTLIWHQNLKTFLNLKNEGPQQITLIKKHVQVWIQASHCNYCFLYISLSTSILKTHTYTRTHKTTLNIQMPWNYEDSDPTISEEHGTFFMRTSFPAQLCVPPNPLSTLCLHPGALYSDTCGQSCPHSSTSMCIRVTVVIPVALHVSCSITNSALPKQRLLDRVSQTCDVRKWK